MDNPLTNASTPQDQKLTKSRRKPRHRDMKRSSSLKVKQTLIQNNSIVENLTLPKDEEVITSFREYFTNRKPFLMFMDFHSLRLTKRTKNQKKSVEASFRCSSCDVPLADFDEINSHVQRTSHIRQLRASWLLYVILNVNPGPEIIAKIDEYLEREVESSASTPGVLSLRKGIFERIQEIVKKAFPQIVLRMVGSSYHGLGLADCDLNMSISSPDEESVAKCFMSFNSLLLNEPTLFQNFEKHICDDKKPPCLSFKWKGNIQCTILIMDDHSHLLAKLIKEYGKIDDRCRKLCVLFRKWAFFCGIDGQSDGCWPSHAFYILVIYFLQQLSDPVLPVLHELVPIESGDYEHVTDTVRALWKTKNTSSLGTLWIQLLTFYSYQFDASAIIVCISQSGFKRRSSSPAPWNSGKRIAIMDPYDPDKNVARGVSNSTLYDFIMHCMRVTCAYYRIPQCQEGPLFGFVRPEPEVDSILQVPGHAEFLDVQLRVSHYIVRLIPYLDSNYLESNSSLQTILEKLNALKNLYVNICSFNLDDFTDFGVRSAPKNFKYKKYALFLNDAQYLMNHVNVEKLSYSFSYLAFTDGEEHPRCCSICLKNGHSQNVCPDMVLEPLSEIPPLDEALINLVDQVCYDVYTLSKPSQEEVTKRNVVVEKLEDYITEIFPEACLTLFGSSRNGFGLKNSDMDICLTFRDLPSNTNVPASTLLHVFRHLKKCNQVRNVVHIHSAKVPIVKFHHNPSGLEGDISLYNTLAQENTKMLRCYSEIDERVKILGYMVKHFARICNVGDASKGSLSSYCYILMTLYFLQRCDPPVIPVLQALPVTEEPLPKRFVDGHNTYFYNDVKNLENIWPQYKQNNKDPGELWIEMLRFYTETFDVDNVVVSIRTPEPVLKIEKRWFTKVFAIEDPFDNSHNLGAGLSRKMNLYIVKTFRNARKLFMSKLTPKATKSLIQCYFDETILAPEEPPNDRGCLLCKCIGHRFRDCPRRHTSAGKKIDLRQTRESYRENEARSSDSAPGNRVPADQQKPQLNQLFTEANRLLVSSKPPGAPKSASKPPPPFTNSQGNSQRKVTTVDSGRNPLVTVRNPPVTGRNPPVTGSRTRTVQDAQNHSYRMFMNSILSEK